MFNFLMSPTSDDFLAPSSTLEFLEPWLDARDPQCHIFFGHLKCACGHLVDLTQNMLIIYLFYYASWEFVENIL